jgi:hypothetical protein
MSLSSHIPVFNPRQTDTSSTFVLFSQLPSELRLNIWRHALHKERILRLHLSVPHFENRTSFVDRLKSAGFRKPQPKDNFGPYSVTLDGHQVLSKLLSVCRESREETLLHYRAHIPCRFLRLKKNDSMWEILNTASLEDAWDNLTTPGTFYFNPEWDFLRISCWPRTSAHLPTFLYDLKTRYDPHGIGLLNLVLSSDLHMHDVDPEALSPDIRDSFEQTLRQLHEVFFYDSCTYGRMNLPVLFGVKIEMWLNRSFPIGTEIPAFERLSPDPRPITNDLRKQAIGGDWCRNYQTFENVLSKFHIDPTQIKTQLKFMITHNGMILGGTQVKTRVDAEKWLTNEKENWWIDRSKWPPGTDDKAFEDEDYTINSNPAFGFFLFDAREIFSAVNGVGGILRDLSMFTPELGLAIMP